MTFETDQRLKSFLDTNQLQQERMCLAVLAIDRRFSNAKPRHPRGGPDGGRDIEALFQGDQKAFGAVGFVNEANDSRDHKTRASKKFLDDLQAALEADPQIAVFVFFTNVNLTVSEKDNLISSARKKCSCYCEIFDRERIRISLDSPDGFGIRLQYLQITMTPEEQASFFARWGDDIQGVIAEGFGKIEKALNRIQFLAETKLPLEKFMVVLELFQDYTASEIGHFRSFCALQLKEPKNPVMGTLFGITDDPNRSKAVSVSDLVPSASGVGNGICGGHWEYRFKQEISADPAPELKKESIKTENYILVNSFTSIGREKIQSLPMSFGYDKIFRFPPYLLLEDLDEAMFALFLNQSLSDKVKAVHVFGNQYKLADYLREEMTIEKMESSFENPMVFSEPELRDPWVRVMHKLGSFSVSFSDTTPARLFSAKEIENKQTS